MTDSLPSQPSLPSATHAVTRLVHHLLRYPADLIDTRHLMRHFHASVADVQDALQRVGQDSRIEEGEAQ